MQITRRGLLIVISSPSGAGKTSICRGLLDQVDGLEMSVSVTTRPARPGEREGVDYFFVDEARYRRMVEENGFLEHARVFDHAYGTPRRFVEERLAAGLDILFDLDWQGAQQLVANMSGDVVTVFVMPPSIGELRRRLKGRAQDSDETVARRMEKAGSEISHWAEYDYVVVNTSLEQAVQQVRTVLEAERLRRRRQVGLPELAGAMIGPEE